MTNFFQAIKDKININKKINKLFEERDNIKYILVPKKDFWIPSDIIKKEWFTTINIFYNIYPLNKKYYLIKLQAEYIEDKDLKVYNNTNMLNTINEGGIKDDYFWVYNIYKYFVWNNKLSLGGKEVAFNIPKDIPEDKFPRKLLRYNFLQEIVDKYNKNLNKIYRKNIDYIDITDELFYHKNKKVIKSIIDILKKIWIANKKSYLKLMEYDKYEQTKRYERFQKVINIFLDNKDIYPLFFEYLDSNLNQSVYLYNWKEEIHKVFNINNINNIIDTKVPYTYIITKGNIMVYFPIYLYFLEKIFFKTFLKLRDIDKLKLSFNEKINLDKIERLPLLMWQLLAHNNILVELIKLYNIINKPVVLWSQKYLLWYSLGTETNNVLVQVDKDIKNILNSGEYSKLIKSDYITSSIEKELYKYNLDFIDTNNPIFKGII